MRQWILRGLGCLFLGIGAVGMVAPVLPGVIFLILAAACFARSSKTAYNWMINNQWFGQYLKDWHEGRGIPLKIKLSTAVFVVPSTILTIVIFQPHWIAKVITVMINSGILIYILSQPTLKKPD